MKLALICTEKLPVPPIRGGAIQILIDGVIPHLSRRHVLTIYSRSDPELAERETVDGVEYVRLANDNYAMNVATELSAKRLAKENYDVIHVFNRPRDLVLYKAVMPESRFVVSLHNEMFREDKIPEDLGRMAVRAADRIMSISDYIGDTIVSRFPIAKRKVKTVYSAIHLQKYRPIWSEAAQAERHKLRKAFGVEGNKVVLFVGRLSAVKGPDVLIQAMASVLKEHPDVVLMIVGSKWFSDERVDEYGKGLRELAAPFRDRIRFTGFVSPEKLPLIYLLGDVFVCSSQWQEPLARVHYEAMGAGLPVITTNRGGNAEIIASGVNGIVIDDFANPQAFAEAISSLFSDPARSRRIAEAGRAFVERSHGFEHAAQRLESIYFEALQRRKKK
jgi:glycosyltransferase involved in cell wall biosynthesis